MNVQIPKNKEIMVKCFNFQRALKLVDILDEYEGLPALGSAEDHKELLRIAERALSLARLEWQCLMFLEGIE